MREPGAPFRQDYPMEVIEVQALARGGRCAVLIHPDRAHLLDGIELPREKECAAWIRVQNGWEVRDVSGLADDVATLDALPPCSLRWDYESALAHEHDDGRAAHEVARARYTAFPEDEWARLRWGDSVRYHAPREECEVLFREWCSQPLETNGLPVPVSPALRLRDAEDGALREQLVDQWLDCGENEKALEWIEASVGTLRPVREWRLRYRHAMCVSSDEAALAAIERRLELSPADAWAHEKRLDLLVRSVGLDRAVQRAREVFAEHVGSLSVQFAVTDFLRGVSEHELVREMLEDLTRRYPDDESTRGNLGRLLIELDLNVEAGLAIARQLVAEAAYGNLAAQRDVALALSILGRQAEAHTAWRELIVARGTVSSEALRGLLQSAEDRSGYELSLQFLGEQLLTSSPGAEALSLFLEAVSSSGAWAPDRVDTFLSRLCETFPDSSTVVCERVEFLLEQSRDQDALEAASAAESRWPWLVRLSRQHASALTSLGRTSEAKALLRERIAERPHAAASLSTNLGQLLENEGQLADAKKVYEASLERAPSPFLFGYLADVEWRLGRQDDAVAHLEAALALNPSYTWASEQLTSWYLQLDRSEKALATAERFVHHNPATAFAFQHLADVQIELKLYEAAVQSGMRALQLDPRLGSARARVFQTLLELRRLDACHDVIAQGVTVHGEEDVELQLMTARLMRAEGDHAGSRERCRAIAEQHPDDDRSFLDLLAWLDEDGRDDDILALYTQPISEASAKSETLAGFAADVYFRRDDERRAHEALEHALKLAPDYQWARSRLTNNLLDNGDVQEAGAWLVDLGDPEAWMPSLALAVARHAVMTRQLALAESTVVHVLLADAFCSTSESAAQVQEVLDALGDGASRAEAQATAADPFGFVPSNIAALAIHRDDLKAYLRQLDDLLAVGEEMRLSRVLQMAAESSLRSEVCDWILSNIEVPIENDRLWGVVLWILADRRDAWIAQHMFADFRRPGAEGWMLANLSNALRLAGRYEDVITVSEHARTLRSDHSQWWHRTYLGEAYLRMGRHDDALAIAEVSVRHYPSLSRGAAVVRQVAKWELDQTPRRVRRRELVPLLRQLFGWLKQSLNEDGDCPSDVDGDDFRAELLHRAVPCFATWCLQRKNGWRLMRLWYGR